MIRLSCLVNTMVADEVVRGGALVSLVRILALFSRINPILAWTRRGYLSAMQLRRDNIAIFAVAYGSMPYDFIMNIQFCIFYIL